MMKKLARKIAFLFLLLLILPLVPVLALHILQALEPLGVFLIVVVIGVWLYLKWQKHFPQKELNAGRGVERTPILPPKVRP